MANYSGTAGNVKRGGVVVAEVKEWSLDIAHSVVDVTAFSEEWVRNISGIRNVSGSFSANTSDDTHFEAIINEILSLDGKVDSLTLYLDSDTYFEIAAFITGLNPGISYDGVSQTTVNFVSDGSITFTA